MLKFTRQHNVRCIIYVYYSYIYTRKKKKKHHTRLKFIRYIIYSKTTTTTTVGFFFSFFFFLSYQLLFVFLFMYIFFFDFSPGWRRRNETGDEDDGRHVGDDWCRRRDGVGPFLQCRARVQFVRQKTLGDRGLVLS